MTSTNLETTSAPQNPSGCVEIQRSNSTLVENFADADAAASKKTGEDIPVTDIGDMLLHCNPSEEVLGIMLYDYVPSFESARDEIAVMEGSEIKILGKCIQQFLFYIFLKHFIYLFSGFGIRMDSNII